MSPSEHSVRARVAERLRRLAAVIDPQRTSPSGGIVTISAANEGPVTESDVKRIITGSMRDLAREVRALAGTRGTTTSRDDLRRAASGGRTPL